MNDSGIKILQVTKELVDEQFISNLLIAFPVKEDNPKWELVKTREFVANSKNLFLIGYIGDVPAGYVYGHILNRFDSEKQFLIYELFTNTKFRRKGVAKKLITHLLCLLREKGFDEAWVLTNKSNKPAMELYSSTGAKPENEDDCMFIYRLKEEK